MSKDNFFDDTHNSQIIASGFKDTRALFSLSKHLNTEERIVWNILLDHAHKKHSQTFEDQEYFQIPVQQIINNWNKSKTEEQLKQILAFCGIKVKYNFFTSPKKQVWGFFTLLSSIQIYKGICYYRYTNHFKQKLGIIKSLLDGYAPSA